METSAEELKEKGNEHFRLGQTEQAITYYEQAAEKAPNDLKSVCYGNISACYLKEGDYSKALTYCDKALEINPNYPKIRERKVRVLVEQGRIKEAKEEVDKGEIDPQLTQRVNSLAEQHFEQEKAEMMSKLKDLGNTVLGKFGLSLDNFQVNQNEGGGYSINFQK